MLTLSATPHTAWSGGASTNGTLASEFEACIRLFSVTGLYHQLSDHNIFPIAYHSSLIPHQLIQGVSYSSLLVPRTNFITFITNTASMNGAPAHKHKVADIVCLYLSSNLCTQETRLTISPYSHWQPSAAARLTLQKMKCLASWQQEGSMPTISR